MIILNPKYYCPHCKSGLSFLMKHGRVTCENCSANYDEKYFKEQNAIRELKGTARRICQLQQDGNFLDLEHIIRTELAPALDEMDGIVRPNLEAEILKKHREGQS